MLNRFITLRSFLITLLVSVSVAVHSHAQTTVKTFYPTFQKFKVESKEINNKDLGAYFDISECVSGDCKNGNGVWLQISFEAPLGYRKMGRNSEIIAYYTVFKGTFKNNGSIFEGKSVTSPMKYYRVNGTKKADPAYTKDQVGEVVRKMDTEEVDFTGICESFQANGKTYFRRLEGFHQLTRRQKGYLLMESEFIWYQKGIEQMAEVTFRDLDSVPYRTIRGIRNRDASFIAGQITYKDGGNYVGFIYNNRRQGTGVFNDQLNPLKKGIWIDDELTYSMELSIPNFLYEARTAYTGSEMNFIHEGTTYQGVGNLDPNTNITFFTSNNGKLFYHGFLTEGIPDYLGSYINLQSRPDRTVATFVGTPQTFLIGIFEQDKLVDGMSIFQEYEVKLYEGPEEDKMGNTYKKKGHFIDGKLDGCGYLESVETGRYNYVEGEFKKGEVVGWHVKNYTDNTYLPNHRGIRHSLYRPPYSNADFEKMKELEASPCIIDQMGGDVAAFVENMKSDSEYSRHEKTLAAYDPIVVSGIDFRNEQLPVSQLKFGQQVFLNDTKQALYVNSYDSASKLLTLQGKVYDSRTGRKVFITEKVPVSSNVYLMRPIVKKDNVSTCFYCAGSGVLSGTRWELVRKKGMRGTKEIGFQGYLDKDGYYHLVHEKVRYSEKCFHCRGKGENVFKVNRNFFELISIVN